MEAEEAILFLTAMTFIIAVGGATAQGIAFWRRYRVRLQVTNKARSRRSLRDLDSAEHSLLAGVSSPAPVLHSRREDMYSRRWPSHYNEHQWDQSYFDRRPQTVVRPSVPFARARIHEEAVSHAAPATDTRDHQGLPEPKP